MRSLSTSAFGQPSETKEMRGAARCSVWAMSVIEARLATGAGRGQAAACKTEGCRARRKQGQHRAHPRPDDAVAGRALACDVRVPIASLRGASPQRHVAPRYAYKGRLAFQLRP